jgi:hypothetical protein
MKENDYLLTKQEEIFASIFQFMQDENISIEDKKRSAILFSGHWIFKSASDGQEGLQMFEEAKNNYIEQMWR